MMNQFKQNHWEKRLLAAFLLLLFSAGLVWPAFAKEAKENTIQISSQEDLETLAENCRLDTWSQGKTVVLTQDLELDESAADFLPIPTFGGTFEGNGHTISGLALTGSDANTGLFDTIQESGILRDLTVVGQVTPTSGDTIGGLAGTNWGKLVNCAFEGVVEGSGSVGGIVGLNETTGQITNCRFRGTLTGEHYVGGIVGQNTGSLIQCQNEGDINTTVVEVSEDLSDLSLLRTTQTIPAGTDIGGIAGFSSGLIQSCQNDGSVGYEHMGYNVGGIVGRQSGYLDGCTNTGTVQGRKDVGGIAGQLEPQVILRYDEDILDQLYTELDTLQTLTNQALSDSQSLSGTLSNDFTSLLTDVGSAKDAASGLSGAITDWGNENVEQVNDASARLSWVISQTEPLVEDVSGGLEDLEETNALLQQALEKAQATGEEGAASASELQSALDSMETAKTDGNACLTHLGTAAETAEGLLDSDDKASAVTDILDALDAAKQSLKSAVNALKDALSHANQAAQGLTELGEPGSEALTALNQATGSLQDVLSGMDGVTEQVASISSTLSDEPAISFSPVSSDVTSQGDALDASLSQMLSSAAALQDNLSSSSNTLTEDFRAINDQIGVITDLVNRNVEETRTEEDPDVVEDISDDDTGDSTQGRITASTNQGPVYGDLNVAGIVGSLSVEYDFDPEDDLTEDGTRSLDFQYKTLAVVTDCVNQSDISAKKDYAGGIVGRMDLGAVKQCENYGGVESTGGDYVGGIAGLCRATIRGCYVKCTLSGGDYVGGVLGAGEEAAQISDCYTLVEIPTAERYYGAISGTATGTFSDNRYVSDTLAGLGRISYAGQAQPVTFKQLSAVKGLPEAMTQFTLRFVVEDEEIQSQTFSYNDSFDSHVFPDIPAKDGYYATWDITDLTELRFDTTVTAEYTRYVLTLPSEAERSSGRTVFLADGDFDGDAVLTATEAETPEKVHGQTPLEEWHLEISDAQQTDYTVRYLAPEEDPDSVKILIRQDEQWTQADCTVFGSYLVFQLPSAQADVVVLAATNPLLRGLLIGLLGLVVVAVLFLLALFIRRVQQSGLPAVQGFKCSHMRPHSPSAPPTAHQTKAPRQRKKWLLALLVLVVLAAGLGIWAAKTLGGAANAYKLLQDFADQPEYAMTLSTDTQLDDQLIHADFEVVKTTVEDQTVSCLYKDGMSLYYADDAVLMENGKAYQLSDLHPDYSLLPSEAARLYQSVEFTTSRSGGTVTYQLTAEGENAKTLLEILLPSQSAYLTDTHKLTLELTAEDGVLQSLQMTSEGTLVDQSKTPYSIRAVLQPTELEEEVTVPAAVQEALRDGLPEEQTVFPEDLFRLLSAWTCLNEAESYEAELVLGVDCGPINVDESLSYQQTSVEHQKIGCVRSKDLAVYFADGQFCSQDGTPLNEAETSLAQRIDLLEVLHEICLNGTFDCVDTGNDSWLYTLTLDEEAMLAVAEAAAPETVSQKVTLTAGSVQILVQDDAIADLRCSCTGGLDGLEDALPVTVSAELRYTSDSGFEVPDAVLEQLTGEGGIDHVS